MHPAPASGWRRVETLRQDAEFVLSRGLAARDSDAVLILAAASEQPPARSVERLRHEYSLRHQLDAAWAAKPRELAGEHGHTVLLLEDPGGELLSRLAGRAWEVAQFIRIAIGIAAALGSVHERGLIHKDVKPANVLVDITTGQAWLTGFAIASRLLREHRLLEPPEMIAGTLAYMAPEQTGRMNRSVDSRSDLYALGVTFYELLTGALPFSASEPMEWIHCHIARKPVPPDERVAGIPGPLSAIVMRLLAKTAEERYQTAAGVEADLRRCLAALESFGCIDPFALGAHDVSHRLLIPEKLYGREREIEALLAAFDRVVANGTPELVLVSGYSGIGKSSVVNELHKVLVAPRGLFASGKFDQYKRDIPYATLAQAFQSLVHPLLGQSEAELGRWRDALREALGPNVGLMVDLVPELELIVAEPPPVPDLAPQDAQRRFQLVFRRFVGVFARPEHPLALFLDDLQWLDTATLDLLEDLLTHPDVQHLLLIGAYRDNEVDAAHPLTRKLDAIRRAGARVQDIRLGSLAIDDLRRLMVDALRCDPAYAAKLVQLVQEKTAGNPFFVIQFLHALADEGLLTFNHDDAGWSWDLDRIHAKRYTDNVVDLMVGKLNRLPSATQMALEQLACLGNAADVKTLSIVLGTSQEQVDADLWEAVRLELIEHRDGPYKFIHDRVQEAAYLLIPPASRAETHLRIGRLLAAQTPPEQREEMIFEIISQLNRAGALVSAQDERDELAEFNLIAGKRAKASTAYASALTYLAAGAALLAEHSWEHRHDLAFALELNRAEGEFLTGAPAAAEERLAALSTRAANTVERATVACLRVDLYTFLDQGRRAIEVGLDYLRHLGIDWSPHPTEDEARREYQRIWSQLGGRKIEDIIELPLMRDPASLATMDVLTKLGPPASITDANLFAMVACRVINLSLEGGNSDASCISSVWASLIAGARFGDYQTGLRFAWLGYELVEQRGLTRFQARTYLTVGSNVMPWTRHLRGCRDMLRRAFEAANRIGDLTYAAYCANQLNTNLLAAGDPLAGVQREAEHGLASRFGLSIDTIATQLGLIRTLRGLTPTFGSFDDEQFDEACIERRFSENPDLAVAEWRYWVRKLQARFFAGDYASAIEASSKAQRLLWTSISQFETAEYHFYGALAQAASCDSAATSAREQHLDIVAAHHKQLQLWAANCPENFEDRAALVGAEIARIEGRALDAMDLYEQAIRSAQTNSFVHNVALAHELAARFYARRGFETIANAYLRNARYCYLRWGAEGKVRQLERLHPQLFDEPAPLRLTTTMEARQDQLDLATVVKMSQTLSGEIVLDKLIETLMVIAVEHAGAERGLLVLRQGEEQRIEAEATTGRDKIMVRLLDTPAAPAELPHSVLQYVMRMRESVILDDASAPNPFSADEYIRRKHARSILCLPLVKQGELIGVLYLDNNLASHVFTPARISVLKLLSSQAAISLQNARLYTELQLENSERRRSEAATRRSEERYMLAVEAAGDGHADWIVATDEFYASPRLLEMCGLPADTTFSGRADFIARFPYHPEDRDRVLAAIKAHYAGRSTRMEIDMRIVRRGETRWMHATLLCSREASGPLLRASTAFTDITDRTQLERQLGKAQRLEAMGTLAGGIAHDFNNILGAILGFGEMAQRGAALGTRLRRDLDSIMTAGERGRALVDRILAFSLSGVGERVPVHIERVVREALDHFSAKLPAGIRLEVRLSAGHAAMMGDPTQVHQVLMNLASNAMQAMPAGGTLRVSLNCERVDSVRAASIGTVNPAEFVLLQVADSGSGIPPDIMDRIFDPFFTTKEVGVGTGLGLSLVHGIVTQLGGAIDVSSRVGAGSVFTVYLPRSGEAPQEVDAEESPLQRGDRQRVLVVDDEEPLVQLVTRTLEELGYVPVGFTSSAAALAAFRSDPLGFDAVITDERMPGMSGSTLIREVHAMRAGIPTMLMSGFTGGAIASHAREAGADKVLKKPVSRRELATSLARVLHLQ